MTRIVVSHCTTCPFVHGFEQGIFWHSYCTFGLFAGSDWREFEPEELGAGLTDVEIRLRTSNFSRQIRYPHTPPDWCGLKDGATIVLERGSK